MTRNTWKARAQEVVMPRTRKPTPSAPARAVPGPVVDARGVSKTYPSGAGQVHALRGIDLRVDRGEMVAVVGPSGSARRGRARRPC